MSETRSALAARRGPWFEPEAGEVVLAPEGAGRGYWVGAPGVTVDEAGARVFLCYRRRRPRDGSAEERGHFAAVAVSTDEGRSFKDIWSVRKTDVGTSSLERFCLRPADGEWLLYTSWEDPPSSGRWRIDVLSAAQPEGFSAAAALSALRPDQVGVDAVKDPYVVHRDGTYLMYVSTFLTPSGPAPTSLALSHDGRNFTWSGEVLGVGEPGSWYAYQARISSVLPFGSGFVGYFDGAATRADDTEEHCGLAVSVDLRTWRPVTTEGPVLVSPHATGSLRYVEVAQISGTWFAYYEYTRADGAHELRRCPLDL